MSGRFYQASPHPAPSAYIIQLGIPVMAAYNREISAILLSYLKWPNAKMCFFCSIEIAPTG